MLSGKDSQSPRPHSMSQMAAQCAGQAAASPFGGAAGIAGPHAHDLLQPLGDRLGGDGGASLDVDDELLAELGKRCDDDVGSAADQSRQLLQEQGGGGDHMLPYGPRIGPPHKI